MAIKARQGAPMRYDLCDQAVTVYHRAGEDDIERTVHPRAFLDRRKNLNVERTGSSEANSFLLVIPGEEIACEVGDKVLPGEGPDVRTDEEWRDFVPSKVPGLVVVRYVDPKHWNSELVHTEAGG